MKRHAAERLPVVSRTRRLTRQEKLTPCPQTFVRVCFFAAQLPLTGDTVIDIGRRVILYHRSHSHHRRLPFLPFIIRRRRLFDRLPSDTHAYPDQVTRHLLDPVHEPVQGRRDP